MKIEEIAKVCHEANKALCESNGDFSQAQWAQSPAWQKGSAVAGVQHKLDNPEALPEDSHKSWLKMKEVEGWKYGEKKDPVHKTHPCFVPYEELPEDQRIKDELFLAICTALIPMLQSYELIKHDVPHTGEKVDVDKVDAKVKMNSADKEAIAMDEASKKRDARMKEKKAKKVLPSGKAMPVIK